MGWALANDGRGVRRIHVCAHSPCTHSPKGWAGVFVVLPTHVRRVGTPGLGLFEELTAEPPCAFIAAPLDASPIQEHLPRAAPDEAPPPPPAAPAEGPPPVGEHLPSLAPLDAPRLRSTCPLRRPLMRRPQLGSTCPLLRP